MKTQGMAHQLEALRRASGREFFALFMEQGTGKTWCALADAERAYAAGKIDGLFVLAPNGVHTNWIRREIPKHLSCEWVGGAFRSGAGKRETEALERTLFRPRDEGDPPPLRVLAMNIDAIITDAGLKLARRFLNATRAMMVVDESNDIKGHSSARTKRVLGLKPFTVLRRIMDGTPITNSPGDAFSQFEFLEEGLLGTTSYRSFFAEYAELMSNDHPMMKNMIAKRPKMAHAQMVVKNRDGTPRWRNLDKLRDLMAPHMYRALKRDCLDLPPKVYQTIFFDMPPPQRSVYERMKAEARIELEDGLHTFVPLARLIKLQQITSGFTIIEGEPRLLTDSPGFDARLSALQVAVEHTQGQFIVWAQFREEIAQIARLLEALGISAVQYHGDVGRDDRERAVDDFQRGAIRAFIGQPRAGGIGITLTAATTTIYYSNGYNLRTRLQSEDRNHRIGTTGTVTYIDIVATDTIDEPIARALQAKTSLAQAVLGDIGLPLNDDELNVDDELAEAVLVVDSELAARGAAADATVVIDVPVADAFIEETDAAASHAEWRPARTRSAR
jgi:hypothetical protein